MTRTGMLVAVVGAMSLWLGIIYIVLHFVQKYW